MRGEDDALDVGAAGADPNTWRSWPSVISARVRRSLPSRVAATDAFIDHVGMSPKGYAGLVRFDRLTQRLWCSPNPSWADLALASGFADQAHLAREVRRFSGLSPTGLRAYLGELARFDPTDTVARVSDVTFVQDDTTRAV